MQPGTLSHAAHNTSLQVSRGSSFLNLKDRIPACVRPRDHLNSGVSLRLIATSQANSLR